MTEAQQQVNEVVKGWKAANLSTRAIKALATQRAKQYATVSQPLYQEVAAAYRKVANEQ